MRSTGISMIATGISIVASHQTKDKNLAGNTLKETSSDTKLERTLTLLDATCLVISSIIGSGIFISPSNVLHYVCIHRPFV